MKNIMKRLVCMFVILFSFVFNTVPFNIGMFQTTQTETSVQTEIIPEPIPIEEMKQYEFDTKLKEIKHIKDESTKEWFFAYKDLTYEYMKWVELPETVYDVFNEDEIRLIWRVVETETYDQDFDSKVNVANVVFNRLKSGDFGETITEVITKENQFAYGRQKITDDTIYAVMYAYEMSDTTQGALYFNSFKEKKESFNGAAYLFTDNCGHNFYKPKEVQ